jgi:hypothetical protein
MMGEAVQGEGVGVWEEEDEEERNLKSVDSVSGLTPLSPLLIDSNH